MYRNAFRTLAVVVALLLVGALGAAAERSETRSFSISSGQALILDLEAGGSVKITGSGGSEISVTYRLGGKDGDKCRVDFEESGEGLKVISRYVGRNGSYSTDIDFEIQTPLWIDLELDSMGGGLELTGVEGTFSGKTMGGQLILHDVRGEAKLTTMGGQIRLTDSELDGSLKTMGGEVLFENVVGDVKGSSMGGNVRYKNVQRRDGGIASPARVGGGGEVTEETVQISTMGGAIRIDEAPEGASLHTMGGDIRVTDASRFVSAKTMGGDIVIDAVDGWVKATTMGGNLDVTVIGTGGEVELQSMSGDVTLIVPRGFSMELDLEIAYTRNSKKDYRIDSDFDVQQSETAEWDYDHGSPRRYIRATGASGGGQNRVRVKTINGDIHVKAGS
jgi:DUF4097 and DUF4098 domain-containing protein YvlB